GGKRPEFPIDEWDELANEIVRVIADRRRVHVLVATQRREAIRKDHDGRSHLALVNEASDALGDVVRVWLPIRVSEAGPGKTDKIPQNRKPPAPPATARLVVFRGQPDAELANVGVAETISPKHFGRMFQHDQLPCRTLGAFERHALPRGFVTAHCNATPGASMERGGAAT